MSQLSRQRVCDYAVAFLRLARGKDVMGPSELASFLQSIGYCHDNRQAGQIAQELIIRYDFSLKGVLNLEDFLLAMEEVENEVKSLREYFEETLRYFCLRKLEQNSESTFGLDDIRSFLKRLNPEEQQLIMEDIENDVIAQFYVSPETTSQVDSEDSSGTGNDKEAKHGTQIGNGNKKAGSVDTLESKEDTLAQLDRKSSVMGPGKLKRKVSIISSASPMRMMTSNNMAKPQDFSRRNKMTVALVNENFIAVPESSLIEIVVNRICPIPREPILYETLQGEITQMITINSMTVTGLESFYKPKLQENYNRLDYATIHPVFVVSCGGVVSQSRPLFSFLHGNQSVDRMILDMVLPSIRSDDIAYWIDEAEVVISVFDFNQSGCNSWTEWIGTTRKRLPWFINRARDGSPVSVSLELDSITPWAKQKKKPKLEFTICFPAALVTLWHTYHSKGAHPKAHVLNAQIEKGLNAIAKETVFLDGDFQVDLYNHWRKKLAHFKKRFPRRRARFLAKDEYGAFHPLPCFLDPISHTEFKSPIDAALTVAAIDSGTYPYCDSVQSSFQYEQIGPPSSIVFSKKGTSLEVTLLLCSAFLGMGMDAYVCFCETEMPWVVTIEDPNEGEDGGDFDANDEAQVGDDTVEGTDKSRHSNAAAGLGMLYNQKNRGRFQLESKTKRAGLLQKKKSKGVLLMSTPESFERYNEAQKIKQDREPIRIKFWNASTGLWYMEDDPSAPRQIFEVFNDKNLWTNVHSSTSICRTTFRTIQGEGHDASVWDPFFTEALLSNMGNMIPKVYSPLDLSCVMSITHRNTLLESKILLSDLVDAISLYRQHKMFIPDTVFDGRISQILQTELLRIKSQLDSINNMNKLSAFNLELIKSTTLERNNLNGVPKAVERALLPGTVWYGTIFEFKTVEIQEIMLMLEEIGILNHTFPGVRYTVAGVVFPNSWGLSSTWVYVGYLREIFC